MTSNGATDARGRTRVAVTGLGVKTPVGHDVDALWSGLLAGRSVAGPIRRFDPTALPVRIACEVHDFDPTTYMGPKEARRVDRVTQLGFAAAADAIADAGETGADPARSAVVIGTGIGGLITLEDQFAVFHDKGPGRVSPFLVPMMMTNATAGTVAMQLGWTGPNLCISTACAASAHAIGEAARLIRDDVSDVVMTGGTEACITEIAISAFARMTALSNRNDDPEHASRPFDTERDGFVMGEGASALLLERWDRAVARGAHIYGEVVGYGRNADAYHITAPSPGGEGAAACMQLALDDAGLSPDAIGHVNAHGTSTPLNDAAEAEAIRKVFGESAPPVTSTKGVTGHLIGAAGATEAVARLLAMRDASVPPTANLDNIGEEIQLDVVAGAPRSVPAAPALSNSFGFGGHNATLIFAARLVTVAPPRGSSPIRAGADGTASAEVRVIDGRRVVWFRIAGGKHHGAIGAAGGATVERAVQLAGQLQIPLIGELDTSGAELGEGVTALHAWGRLARELVSVSGAVPTLLAVTGACVSGPALALGCFDQVVMTEDAFAFVTGPDSVADFTGEAVTRAELGGSSVHDRHTGVAALVVRDEVVARDALIAMLAYLPDHHLDDPPRWETDDPADRLCTTAAATIPDRPNASYDVRVVIGDITDDGSQLELRAGYAPNLVTMLATLDGRPVGVVANQPAHRAGTIDIEASRKAARFIAWCDVFNLPIITLVDTPGFEPGRDLEWRGMIRHGAELVHAYAAATVPRLCVVMRKAYGGAYIVMDSRGIGNDLTVAWPGASIAVMGGPPAVQILHGKRLRGADPDVRMTKEVELVTAYEAEFDNPYRAAERGLVDAVIAPEDTRALLCRTLDMLATKQDLQPARRHSNTPL